MLEEGAVNVLFTDIVVAGIAVVVVVVVVAAEGVVVGLTNKVSTRKFV
jgi:hypothetical protein